MYDSHVRQISYLRISVTDRCNLRCVYCMPESGVTWIDHTQVLSYEEILTLATQFASLGIERIRLTGGEPLTRKGLPTLIGGLKKIPGIRWVGLTTNGVLLPQHLPELLNAGLDAVNISINTLNSAQYMAMTRCDELHAALDGLAAARQVPALQVKVNCVPSAGNADQWAPLAALAREGSAVDVRFIELMPIGLGSFLSQVQERDVLHQLQNTFGTPLPCPQDEGGGPGRYVTFPGFSGRVGFISAISHQFCDRCNRVRLTATGTLKLCLQYESNLDLRVLLRGGADERVISTAIERAIYQKPACHHFGTVNMQGDEPSNMNQIGG